MVQKQEVDFLTLEVGSGGPSMGELTEIEVMVSVDGLFKTFAANLAEQAFQRAPNEAKEVALTKDEIIEYADYLLSRRIDQVVHGKGGTGKLQDLWYPSFLVHCLQMIGRVVIRNRALLLLPTKEVMIPDNADTFLMAKKISLKFETLNWALRTVKGGFPRSIEGNQDVMSVALVVDRVRTIQHVGHVAMTYIGAVMNFTLRKEIAVKLSHPIFYDDVKFLESALLYRSELY